MRESVLREIFEVRLKLPVWSRSRLRIRVIAANFDGCSFGEIDDALEVALNKSEGSRGGHEAHGPLHRGDRSKKKSCARDKMRDMRDEIRYRTLMIVRIAKSP